MPWSDWITPDPYVFDPFVASFIAHEALDATSVVAGNTDAGALSASAVATVRGGGGVTNSTSSLNLSPGFRYGATKSTDGSGAITVTGNGGIVQFAVTLDGSGYDTAFDWFPDLLSTLVEGVDYGPRPDRSPGDDDYWVEYEGPSVAVAGWQDWPLSTTQADGLLNGTDATVAFPASWAVRFASIPAVDPLGDYWAAYTDGTTLDSASVTVDTSTQNSGSVYSHAAAWSHTVALGGVGATETWTLLVQPSFLGADPSFWDFSAPAAPSDSRTWTYSSHLALSAFSISHAPLPQVLWQAPRWRYWIPDTATKWHTVGGHWGDLGSVPLKILTPLPGGNQWVDVVDGPA